MVSCHNLCECTMKTTNEWQFLKGLSIDPISFLGLVAVNDEVYILSCGPAWLHECPAGMSETWRVECYNPGSDEWKLKTKITMTLEKDSCLNFAIRGTVKVFRGLRSSSQITLCNNRNVPSPTQDKLLRRSDKRKCSIMWFLKKLTSLKFSSLIIVDNSCSLELPSCGWEKTIKCYIPRQTLFKKDFDRL